MILCICRWMKMKKGGNEDERKTKLLQHDAETKRRNGLTSFKG